MGMLTGDTPMEPMPQVTAQDPTAPMPQVTAQDPTAPMPTGMMGATKQTDPTTSHGAYNGEVDVQGQKVQVQNGVAQVEGQPYFVSDNGAMVVDHKGRLIGHVTDGVFQVITAEYMNKMADSGYVR